MVFTETHLDSSIILTQAARQKKIRSTCIIVKTAFSQNNNSAPKAEIPVRSDPTRSDPESDPESDPGFVNGRKMGPRVRGSFRYWNPVKDIDVWLLLLKTSY